jgi:hypothetical protein
MIDHDYYRRRKMEKLENLSTDELNRRINIELEKVLKIGAFDTYYHIGLIQIYQNELLIRTQYGWSATDG